MTISLYETKNELRYMYDMFDEDTEQVPICKVCNEEGDQIGFGEHLLYAGKVDAYELESALRYQNVEHIALGVLAIREKYLNGQQLCDVLDYQRLVGGLFGEIAVKFGFLNEEDVDALLKMQDENHIRIGGVLVLFGAISREDMESELQDFHAHVSV